MRYLPILLVIGLVVYTVVDVVNADDDDRLGVHRGLWILGMVLFPPLGSIAWLAVRFSRRRGQGRVAPGGSSPRGGSPTARTGPLAPDDDPEFLWRLEQERRRRERGSQGGSEQNPLSDEDDAPRS